MLIIFTNHFSVSQMKIVSKLHVNSRSFILARLEGLFLVTLPAYSAHLISYPSREKPTIFFQESVHIKYKSMSCASQPKKHTRVHRSLFIRWKINFLILWQRTDGNKKKKNSVIRPGCLIILSNLNAVIHWSLSLATKIAYAKIVIRTWGFV